jgi:hypothetical protein
MSNAGDGDVKKSPAAAALDRAWSPAWQREYTVGGEP